MVAQIRPLPVRQSQPVVRLVANDRPLVFSPTLAVKVGLEGAVFLQQLHYWTSQPGAHERDGYWWVYNTIDQWLEQFPFWSRSALHRVIAGLEAKGLIVSTAAYNESGGNRTKWYRIDFDHPDLVSLLPHATAQPDTENPSNDAISRIRDMEIPNPGNGISKSQNRDLLIGKQETTTENDTPLPPKGEKPAPKKPGVKTGWPDDFVLTFELWQYAVDQGIDPEKVDAVWEDFRLKSQANGYKKVSWKAFWQTWVRSSYQDRDRVPVSQNGHHANGALPLSEADRLKAEIAALTGPDWQKQGTRYFGSLGKSVRDEDLAAKRARLAELGASL